MVAQEPPREVLQNQQASSADSPNRCSMCSKDFSNPFNVKRHVESVHLGKPRNDKKKPEVKPIDLTLQAFLTDSAFFFNGQLPHGSDGNGPGRFYCYIFNLSGRM